MTQLVGIVNVTPDSFSDGGVYFDPHAAIAQAEKLFSEGAAIVDIGAESTRPHAAVLSPADEWQRLEPVLTYLLRHYPDRISVDSYHPETQQKALDAGSRIVNDVTMLRDPRMFDLVVKKRPIIIVSHSPYIDLQRAHRETPVHSIAEVRDDLLSVATRLEEAGLKRAHIILDPGIGFGKTMDLNRELLRIAAEVPEYQVLIGYSRKRFLGEERFLIGPNLAAAENAIESGAAYLRVHDVAAHAQFLSAQMQH